MKVIKVKKDDRMIIYSIIEDLLDNSGEQPSINHLEKLLADDRTYLFAAILDDKVIGYALAYRFPSLYTSDYLAYLYDIEVLATYRRQGAGRLLIETLLAHLKSDGVSELWLGTATDNIEGQAFFSATGGIKSGETFNDFTYELIEPNPGKNRDENT
ncbi:MAG: GNAT family N-acetyltransferase [Flavisolibacter sp.]|nr:GNAT family N-acetyltransferase [Flavisolibacter sp.]